MDKEKAKLESSLECKENELQKAEYADEKLENKAKILDELSQKMNSASGDELFRIRAQIAQVIQLYIKKVVIFPDHRVKTSAR